MPLVGRGHVDERLERQRPLRVVVNRQHRAHDGCRRVAIELVANVDRDGLGHTAKLRSRCLDNVRGPAVGRLAHTGVGPLAPEKRGQLVRQRQRDDGFTVAFVRRQRRHGYPFSRPVMLLDPRAGAELLPPALSQCLQDLGWETDRFTAGQQPRDAPVQLRGRWQAKDGHMGDPVQEQPVDREVGLGCGIQRLLQPLVGAKRWAFAGKASRFVVRHWFVFGGASRAFW